MCKGQCLVLPFLAGDRSYILALATYLADSVRQLYLLLKLIRPQLLGNDEDVPAGIVSSKTAWNCQNWRIQDQKDTCNNKIKQLLFRATRLSSSMHIPVGTCCHAPLNTLIALAYDSALGAWKHNIQVSSSPWDSIDVIEVHYAVILQGNSPGHGLQFTCWKSGCRTVPYDVSLADI